MQDKTASEQIDSIIESYDGWKRSILTQLRKVILDADPNIIEEVKWKTASRPEGLPVWSYNGIVCLTEIWKDNIKLIFFQGYRLTDPDNLFNARLKSATVRAVEFREGDEVNGEAIKELVIEGVKVNSAK